MRNLIRADLRRILRKPSIYVWLAVLFLQLMFGSGFSDYTADTLTTEYGVLKIACPLMVSIPVFLGVFGDEMKCGAVQCIIGRGISRSKVVLAKYFECMILAGIYFAVIELIMYGRNMFLNVGTTPTQNVTLAIFILMLYLKTIGFLAFSSFFVYLSWSTAPGMVALLTIISLLSLMLQLVQKMMHMSIYDYWFEGLIDAAYAEISVGNFGYQLIPAFLMVIAVLILTMVVFNKKEIEF